MKVTLTNGALLNLQKEINDIISSTDDSVLKFYLISIHEATLTLLKAFNTVRDELLNAKATKDESGNFILKQINDDIDPALATEADFTDEYKEYLELLALEVEVTATSIPIKQFSEFKSKTVYPLLAKFVKLD